MRGRAQGAGEPIGWAAIAFVVGFVIWTLAVSGGNDVPEPVAVLAIIAVLFAAAPGRNGQRRLGVHRVRRGDRVGGRLALHRPLPQRDGLEHQRRLQPDRANAASGGYALKVMTIVTVLFFPVVLIYQGWSFWVFRSRVLAPPDPENPDSKAPPRVAGRRTPDLGSGPA